MSIALPSLVCFAALHQLLLHTAPKRLDRSSASYWAASATSVVHALIVVPLAYVASAPLWLADDLLMHTPASRRVMEIFVGYTMADSAVLLRHRQEWVGADVYLAHHAVAVCCWGTLVCTGHAHALATPILLIEATAPFVNGRWFLSTLGMKDSFLYVANAVLMAVSFFWLRVVFLGWLLFDRLVCRHEQFFAMPAPTVAVITLGCVSAYPLQIVWFCKIVAGLRNLLSERSQAK